MPQFLDPRSDPNVRVAAFDGPAVRRHLTAAYARERIADVVRAVAEDALDPALSDSSPWSDEPAFEDDLNRLVAEIAVATTGLLSDGLADLLGSAPPKVVGRLATAGRWPGTPERLGRPHARRRRIRGRRLMSTGASWEAGIRRSGSP